MWWIANSCQTYGFHRLNTLWEFLPGGDREASRWNRDMDRRSGPGSGTGSGTESGTGCGTGSGPGSGPGSTTGSGPGPGPGSGPGFRKVCKTGIYYPYYIVLPLTFVHTVDDCLHYGQMSTVWTCLLGKSFVVMIYIPKSELC